MSQIGSGLARYGNVKIMTASPADNIVMLYDAIFKFLREGIEASRLGDRVRLSRCVGQANKIFTCLLTSLDREVSPALCDQLEPLYGFCMRHLLEANVKGEAPKLQEVLDVLSPLRSAWATAAAQLSRSGGRAPATTVAASSAAR
jgi:flagellar protein FliS